eukprot:gene10447-biopygen9974
MQVSVEVSGPDAKAIKATYAAFHTFSNGKTKLSCSGLLLPQHLQQPAQRQAHVLAPVTCLYPFLQQAYRSRPAAATHSNLLPGTSITALLQAPDSSRLLTLPAQLVLVVRMPAVQEAAEQLLQATSSAGPGSWKLGWLLADQQPAEAALAGMLAHVALLVVDVSPDVMEMVSWQQQQQQHRQQWMLPTPVQTKQQQRQQQQQECICSCSSGAHTGLGVAVQGSPFGCLAPQHFCGAVVTGIISLVLQSAASNLAPRRLALQPPGTAVGAATAPYPTTATVGSGEAPAAAALAAAAAAAAEAAALLAIDARSCGRLMAILALPLSNSTTKVELMLGVNVWHVLAAATAAAAGAGAAGASTAAAAVTALHALLPVCSSNSSSDPRGSSSLARQATASCDHAAWQAEAQHQQPQPQRHACCQAATAGAVSISRVVATSNSSSAAWSCAPPGCHTIPAAAHAAAAAAAVAAARRSVMMVRMGRSWGSGVVMTSSGLILTNAHLFAAEDTSSRHAQVGNTNRSRTSARVLLTATASIRLTREDSSSSSWLPAKLLHCFQGYLDLAVLQVLPDSLEQLHLLHQGQLEPLQLHQPGFAGTSGSKQLDVVQAVQAVHAGQQVFVLGHGLFGPAVGWPPAVTSGCAARVICLAAGQAQQQQQEQQWRRRPAAAAAAAAAAAVAATDHAVTAVRQQLHQQRQKPSMVISTAAVHAGASGGALVNDAGELIGLVTSNARHARGTTLPHLNFCISAEELAPVWTWAQQQHSFWQQQQQQPAGTISSSRTLTAGLSSQQQQVTAGIVGEAALQQLRQLDSHDPSGKLLWALMPSAAAADRSAVAAAAGNDSTLPAIKDSSVLPDGATLMSGSHAGVAVAVEADDGACHNTHLLPDDVMQHPVHVARPLLFSRL